MPGSRLCSRRAWRRTLLNAPGGELPVANAILEAARAGHAAGLCVVPVAEDGTKRPGCGSWDRWQTERPSQEQMRSWFVAQTRGGLGLICGQVSGNVECFEFDDRAAYDEFRAAAAGTGLGALVDRLERGYCEDTPNGGTHWLYRCAEIGGNTKLAQRPTRADEQQDEHDRIKVLIETRGEGGFVITAPSNGTVHPTGRAYALRSGGFGSIDTITSNERRALFQLARSFDQMPRQQRRERREQPPVADGDRPGDDFAARVSWAEVLEPAGWRHLYDRGDTAYWQRPGKDGPGASATVNHGGADSFYVFSTATPFDNECSYTKFAAYAVLNHGGHFSAAAKALAAQGYGKAFPGVQQDLAHTDVGPFVPSDRSEREPEAGPPDVETTLAQCDLADIPTPPSAANMAKLEGGLRRLRAVFEAADPLRIAAVRSALVVKCQVAKVPSPAALIDSALAPLKKTAAEQNQRDLELFPNDEPWPNAVDGVALLDDLRDVIRRHVVVPPGADTAIPLWCLHTHLMDCWDVSPFLLISSPVWRCGKSTLADFVAGFSRRQLMSSNTSEAALYRGIEKFAPTLILDEADSWIKMRDELRGILNSGHKRSGAKVLRAEGDTHEPTVFSTWAAKVVALIGRPPATIGDRSIVIPMRRKTKQERVKRVREKRSRAICEPLRRQCARWADDHREALSTAEPVLSDALTDLHVHDLRREFACRLRESGAPDHEVAAWLGHANISTTSIYLKTNRVTLQKAAKRFDRQRKLCKAIVKSLPIAPKTNTPSKRRTGGKSLE